MSTETFFNAMTIIKSLKQMHTVSTKYRLEGKTIGFVPTMGALHNGHLSLIKRARKENDIVVVSIFVNPTQFGPTEDFRSYPRPIEKDTLFCKNEGVDFIFYPKTTQMYPQGFRTYVTAEELEKRLCGSSRPGHFRAVATVVTKLVNIVSPDNAYFGQKDAQQAIIIKRVVSDLNMPVTIKVMPTIRQKYGLALSSRNLYLSEEEKKDALVLFQSLNLAKCLIKKGVKDSADVIHSMQRLISQKKSLKLDYIAIVDLESLNPIKKISGKCLIALAVWIGKTRLIDNVVVKT